MWKMVFGSYNICLLISEFLIENKKDFKNINSLSKTFNEASYSTENPFFKSAISVNNCQSFNLGVIFFTLEGKSEGFIFHVFEKYFKKNQFPKYENVPKKFLPLIVRTLVRHNDTENLENYHPNDFPGLLDYAIENKCWKSAFKLAELGYNQKVASKCWNFFENSTFSTTMLSRGLTSENFDITKEYIEMFSNQVDEYFTDDFPKEYSSHTNYVPGLNSSGFFQKYECLKNQHTERRRYSSTKEYFSQLNNEEKYHALGKICAYICLKKYGLKRRVRDSYCYVKTKGSGEKTFFEEYTTYVAERYLFLNKNPEHEPRGRSRNPMYRDPKFRNRKLF